MRLEERFSLEDTLTSGQAFTWTKLGGRWYGVADGKALAVWMDNDFLYVKGREVDESFITRYFGLETPLKHVQAALSKEPTGRRAVKAHPGLRLLQQDPWGCLLAFSLATHTNVKAVGGMLRKLGRRFGASIPLNDVTLYTLPTPQRLAKASLRELAACSLGFRAPRIRAAARAVAEGVVDLEGLHGMSFREARRLLLSEVPHKLLPGVGRKVADCVLLYSYNRQEAVPVDIWVARLIHRFYRHQLPKPLALSLPRTLRKGGTLSPRLYAEAAEIIRHRYPGWAGYAQLYLYHWWRTKKR